MSCSKVLTATESDTDGGEQRWQPDEQLIPAILAGSPKRMSDLCEPDRCWTVAGLGRAGLTAEDIADRLKCSLRLVRTIRAMPLTRAFVYAQTETATWIQESQLAAATLAAVQRELETTRAELAAARDRLGRLIDAHITGTESCGRCGTPWDHGNTYWEGTKRRCRNCNRLKQQAFRDRRKNAEVGLDPQDAPRNPFWGYDMFFMLPESPQLSTSVDQ